MIRLIDPLRRTKVATKLIKRIGVEDPRMAKAVVHGGVVYLSGLTDTTVEDGEQTRLYLWESRCHP